jgi:hypothetical protein
VYIGELIYFDILIKMSDIKQTLEPTRICVAIDIEKAGAFNLQHPVVAIGVVVGLAGNVDILERKLIKIRVHWPIISDDGKIVDYGDFEPRCWDEFWSKRPEELKSILRADAVNEETAIRDFVRWLDALETKYPVGKYKIKFLCDNPSYDLAAIDVLMEKWCKRAPLRYSTVGKYRGLADPTDMLEMLCDEDQDYVLKKVKSQIAHDHNPTNDAECVYRTYLFVLLARKSIVSREAIFSI